MTLAASLGAVSMADMAGRPVAVEDLQAEPHEAPGGGPALGGRAGGRAGRRGRGAPAAGSVRLPLEAELLGGAGPAQPPRGISSSNGGSRPGGGRSRIGGREAPTVGRRVSTGDMTPPKMTLRLLSFAFDKQYVAPDTMPRVNVVCRSRRIRGYSASRSTSGFSRTQLAVSSYLRWMYSSSLARSTRHWPRPPILMAGSSPLRTMW